MSFFLKSRVGVSGKMYVGGKMWIWWVRCGFGG